MKKGFKDNTVKGPGLKRLHLPGKMDLAGDVEVLSAEFLLAETGKTKDRQGFNMVDGFRLRINLKFTSEVCGHKVPDFYATVTHTFDPEELEKLMNHLNK